MTPIQKQKLSELEKRREAARLKARAAAKAWSAGDYRDAVAAGRHHEACRVYHNLCARIGRLKRPKKRTPKLRDDQKSWAAVNREKRRASWRAYYERHKKEILSKQKAKRFHAAAPEIVVQKDLSNENSSNH